MPDLQELLTLLTLCTYGETRLYVKEFGQLIKGNYFHSFVPAKICLQFDLNSTWEHALLACLLQYHTYIRKTSWT